jgi:hypothetical protein
MLRTYEHDVPQLRELGLLVKRDALDPFGGAALSYAAPMTPAPRSPR